jgi:hypothetical protein
VEVTSSDIYGETLSELRMDYKTPVTVIEGHFDLDAELREAFKQGFDVGHGEGELFGRIDTASPPTPQPIAGVEPVVVEGFTFDGKYYGVPWVEANEDDGLVLCAWKDASGVCNTPCLVAIWPGLKDGKRVDAEVGK